MGEPRQITNNGVRVWQVNKVITEHHYVENQDGTRSKISRKVRLRGTAPTKSLARQRLDYKYKEYLVKTGELPLSSLGLNPTEVATTTQEWLEKWFKRRVAGGTVQSETLGRDATSIRLHIVPHIGDKPIRLLTTADINTLLLETLPAKRKVLKNPETGLMEEVDEPLLGSSPIRKVRDILSMALKSALKDGLVLADPMVGVDSIKKMGLPYEKEHLITQYHYIPRRVIKGLAGQPELGRWILAFFGLRQSERLGVELSSFTNLENREKPAELRINRQLAKKPKEKGFYVKYTTKTKAGKRILILPESMREALILWKKQRDEWKKQPGWNPPEGLEDLFFTRPDGSYISQSSDRGDWRGLLDELKLPYLWGHAMRHQTATSLGKAGVNPEIAKTILGHSDSLMTAYYQHYNKSDTAQPLQALADALHKDVKQKQPKKQPVLELRKEGEDTAEVVSVESLYDTLADGEVV